MKTRPSLSLSLSPRGKIGSRKRKPSDSGVAPSKGRPRTAFSSRYLERPRAP
ncbi:hypothetical protein LY78DRAFT_659421 [Colletotrichum sublineola]|nr:hypothetical protein LY78DRAFT_659421 [Colletotrichum sublineola]